jgi:spore coat protein H
MRHFIPIALLSALISGCWSESGVGPLADGGEEVPLLAGYINEDDYLSLLDSRFTNVRVPIELGYRGERRQGTIEAAGAGTRYYPQWSYRIRLDDAGVIEGELNDFNVSAQVTDRSLMRNALASELFRLAGFPVFTATYSRLAINGRDHGLHLIIERIDTGFFHRRGIPVEELVKVGFGSSFSFNVPNNPVRTFEKRIPEDNNLNNLVDLIHALDTIPDDRIVQDLPRYLNYDQYLLYHAISSVIKGPDNFRNNFYFYKTEPAGAYQILPWDFDLTFNSRADIGFYGDNEIIWKLLRNDSCFARYKAILQNVVENLFTEDRLFPIIDSLSTHVSTAYSISPYHGGIGYSLQEEGEKLKQFIRERREELLRDLPNFID